MFLTPLVAFESDSLGWFFKSFELSVAAGHIVTLSNYI